MSESLNVAGLGMVSSLGIGAEYNAAAMRCQYDGFIQTDSHTVGNENLLVSKVEIEDKYRGNKRLAKLMQLAINEAITNLPTNQKVPLYVCLAEENPLLNNTKSLSADLIEALKETDYADKIDYQQSIFFAVGRISFVKACQHAQQTMQSQNQGYILAIAVDSLLQPQTINYYQSQLRLLQPGNSDAFIPGEAAVAILLTQHPLEEGTEILGLSTGKETGTIISDQANTGQGLTHAINEASKATNIPVSETDFRISTASGENYFFKELTIVHSRVMDKTRKRHPLWHPADSIGEVGAALAPAMIVMAHYAFKNNYAPGRTALCHISNDNEHRAAFILRKRSKANG